MLRMLLYMLHRLGGKAEIEGGIYSISSFCH